MCRKFIITYGFALCIWAVAVSSVTDWDFVILRMEYNTSNPDVANFDIRPLRVSPGVYAVNGSISVGTDIDNTNTVTLKLYRSASGNSQFRSTPFELQETTFYNFMTSIYVKMLQKDLVKCTNLPVYENSFEGPFPKGTYVFNKCVMSNDGMPGHIQPGLYRATGHFTGEIVEVWVSIFFEVNAKSMV